jgi:malate dehydrogenase (oxaloacetate-decarboxylating)(NADP+)
MESGVARCAISDLDAYRESLERIMGPSREVMRLVTHKVQRRPLHRIVFPEGQHDMTIRAARAIVDQRLARPVLLGRADVVEEHARAAGIDPGDVDLVDVAHAAETGGYAGALFRLRQRKGMTPARAEQLVRDPTLLGLLMVARGEVDGFVGGLDRAYSETIRPALQIVGLREGVSRVSALHLLVLKDRLVFFADTMVNIEPTPDELSEIAALAADTARFFDIEPRVALLAFSSFGSVRHPKAERVARAVELLRERRPDIVADGEMHAATALVEEIVRNTYPQSRIRGDANVLVFPDLTSGNIGYQLVQRLGRAEVIGPILMGMRRPVSVLNPGVTVADIVNLTAITALAADASEDIGSHALTADLLTLGV